MLKRNFWKLALSLAVIVWAVSSIVPLKDQPFADFAEQKARTKSAEFSALIAEASERVETKQSPSVFMALKAIAAERKIDLTQYFPQYPIESSVGNIEKRNTILLDHLLSKSKGRLQLGLDLKGGVAFTLEAVTTPDTANIGEVERQEKLAKAIEIIDERINGLGVAEPIIRAVGNNRIEVQLPGVNTKDNPEIVASVQKPARLDFKLVYPFGTPAQLGETPAGYEVMTLEQEVRGQTVSEQLYIKRLPSMTGEGVSGAFPVMDEYGRFKIALRFNEAGAARFAEVTREIAGYTRQLVQQTGNPSARARLAIVLDGKLYSAPGVENEISGGSAEISGSFTQREATELANVLNNPLDLPLQIREQYEVGPSLAEDAISSGLRAAVLGTVLVAAFMITFYTVGGIVAVAVLGLNVFIIFATMASIGATLTLPGLAGIVLTIGMAVDANILIFERMREEIEAGKNLRTANDQGFFKALWTILDAHFVQLFVCAVMIWLGTGPIKGFGVTLAIGVVSTLFTVLITGHLVMEFLVESSWVRRFSTRRLIGAINVDFVKYGRPAFIGSWVVVALAIGVVAYKGERVYGIDFTGGDVISLQFEQRLDTGDVRRVGQAAGIGEINPTYVSALGGGREVLRIETTADRGDAMLEALQKTYPDAGLTLIGKNHVGASIGKEIQWTAFVAILVSMLAILVYIAFRFEFGFGMGAMVSSTHDILMTIGIFVLFGHQFSAPMVAAILATAGYSINETVVVFDRIREELKLNPTGNLRTIVNTAINKVFARTIMTATSTFLAALALFLFGGGVLRDISFTFMVGIVTSTFSAIFISAQIFYWWHKGDRKNVEKGHDVKPTYEWDAGSKVSQ